MPFLVAFILLAPLLPLLAHFPQSPDGAEMVSVAVNGGVLHPSGIPLQAWINYFLVQVLPFAEPGYILSFVSWLGGFGTVVFLLLLLRRLHVGPWAAAFAVAALVYSPVFALMSITPEKYTWLTFTQMFFVYVLARVILDRDSSGRTLCLLGMALGLAFAQHSANVILLPPFLYVIGRSVLTAENRFVALRWGALALAVAGVVSGGLYASLLWQRALVAWPDWGQLETLADVWNHVVRQDYGYVQLYHNSAPGENSISAPALLFKGLFGWHMAFLFVPLGMWAAFRDWGSRAVMGYLWMILLPGLAVLASTKMPSGDLNTVMGYQERYPILLLPLLTVFWAWGWKYVLERLRNHERMILGVAGALMAVHVGRSLNMHRVTDNNIVEIYRAQAARELDPYGVFWTGSDFTAFYGIPPASSSSSAAPIRYPLKALIGMDWYREKTLPQMAPALARILQGPNPPGSLDDLVRKALNEGFKITLTEPTRFLQNADLMAMAEQTGVLWNFSSGNNSLYTRSILENSVSLCGLFPKVWHGLPAEGLWFVREYLDSFKFAFLSAGDFFQSTMNLEGAAAARSVAEVLVPGRRPDEWVAKCDAYLKIARSK